MEIFEVTASLIIMLILWYDLTIAILDTAHNYFEVKNSLGFLLLAIVFSYGTFVIKLLTCPNYWGYALLGSIVVYILSMIIDIIIGVYTECKRRFS